MLDIQYFLVPEWILLWGSRISIVKMVRLMYGALDFYICIRCVPPHHSKFDYILTISTMMPTTMMQSSSASNLFDIVPMFYLLVPSYNLTPIRYVYIYYIHLFIYLTKVTTGLAFFFAGYMCGQDWAPHRGQPGGRGGQKPSENDVEKIREAFHSHRGTRKMVGVCQGNPMNIGKRC